MKSMVVGFVEEFFSCFDRDDRGPLLNAYHEAALFSLSSANVVNSKYSKDREKLDYNGQSRNFLRMQHDDGAFDRIISRFIDFVSRKAKAPGSRALK